MGTCLSPQTNPQLVYKIQIARIYQDIQKITTRQSFNKQTNFYYSTLQPSLNRKGTVKKLIQHLQSHKTKILRCANYIRSTQFKQNTKELPYYCLILLILQELARNISTLTQEQELQKKQGLSILNPRRSNRKYQKKKSVRKDPLVSVRSESICLNFQTGISILLKEFIGSEMTKEMCLSCMNVIKKFSSFELFKFDKNHLNEHLKLLLQLSQSQMDSHSFCFLFLTNLSNYLVRGEEEADPNIHYEILNRMIEIRGRHRELLENNEEALSTYREIFDTYEALMKIPQYRILYKVPLEELDGHLEKASALFEFEYNNILLYVLLNCLLIHSNVESEELNDLDNFNISSVIDIKQYKNLCSIKNRNTVFDIVIKYMKYGHGTNQERFIIPFRKLCVCFISNIGISEVHVKSWIPKVEDLFDSIQISPLNFVRQLSKRVNEVANTLSSSRLKDILEIVKLMFQGKSINKGQFPTISELMYGCNFKISDLHGINLQIAEIYYIITSLKLTETMDEYGREPYLPMFRFMHDFFSIIRFNNEDAENLYGILMYFTKICQNLLNEYPTRINHLLVITQKALSNYNDTNDTDYNMQFKFLFFELLVHLFKLLKLDRIENHVKNYTDLHEDIRFIYSVESKSNSKDICNKLREFHYYPLKLYTPEVVLKKIHLYNIGEFHRAKMSLGGEQSTKPEEESGEYGGGDTRVRKTSVVFSADLSYGQESSFANLLQTIKDS